MKAEGSGLSMDGYWTAGGNMAINFVRV